MKTHMLVPLLSLIPMMLPGAEEAVFGDTFEESRVGDLNGLELSTSGAIYTVIARNAVFRCVEDRDGIEEDMGKRMGRLYCNKGGKNMLWIKISTDLNGIYRYVLRINHICFDGYGVLAIKAGGRNSDLRGSYQFVYENDAHTDLYYTDMSEARNRVGCVIPERSSASGKFCLRDVIIRVEDGRQWLSINGEPYGEHGETEGRYDDGLINQIRIHACASDQGAFDVGLDNISAALLMSENNTEQVAGGSL